MSAALRPAIAGDDSQLGTWKRLRLYVRHPSDAFAIVSERERRRDVPLVFALYFVARLPVSLQRAAALGHLDRINASVGMLAAVTAGAVVGGVVLTLLIVAVSAALLHVVVNVLMGAGRTVGEMFRLLVLCMAPSLILLLELPSIVFGFRDESTFLTLLLLRLLTSVLAGRMFYWGLRRLFGRSHAVALALTLAPAGVLVLLGVALALR